METLFIIHNSSFYINLYSFFHEGFGAINRNIWRNAVRDQG